MKPRVAFVSFIVFLIVVNHAGRAAPDFMGESWTADGVETGGQFGYAVAGAGDVNGDGYDDLVVGAPRVDNGVYRAGAAFVYHGGPGGLAPSPTWDIGGSDTGERLGHAVAGAGDVNGDGFDDLIVGAYRYNSGLPEAGTAYVYYGSLYGLSTLPDWNATGDLEWAHFGYAVAAAGDVNGDGYDDVIVGARWYGAGAANGGAAFLYLGSELGLAATPAWSATGDQVQMALGTTVAGLGDVNGDGFDDIIVGAPYFDAPEEDAGAVFGYYGAPAGPGPTPDWVVTGPQADALLGAAIGAAGDVNGDGFDDALLGAPQADGVVPDVGTAQIHLGSPSGLSAVANWTVTGGQALSSFGIAVSGAGDVNHDGFDDVVVGASQFDLDQSEEGASFLYFGADFGPQPIPAWHGEGNKAETQYGLSVAAAGDVNGDTYADLAVGAPLYRLGTIIVGRAFLYQGGEAPLTHRVFLPALAASGG